MLHNRNWPTWLGYILAIIVFVVAAFYAVMYATGYRLNFTTWEVQETGVLAITTHPSGATIRLDGKENTRRTPLAMRNLLPNTYNLEIQLDGYRPYTQKVEIVSGAATELSNIDLVLEKIEPVQAANNVGVVVAVNGESKYFGADNKLYSQKGESVEEITFDRIPAHVQTILASATKINSVVAKGNELAINLNVGARRWLVVADTNGFRGAAFGAPINTAEAANTWWIDNDRLAFLVAGNLHTLDLNNNEITLYKRGVLGVRVLEGRTYFVAPNDALVPALWIDNNLLDEREAEVAQFELPVGKDFELVSVDNNQLILLVGAKGSQTLWIVENNKNEMKGKQTRVAAEVSSLLYNAEKQTVVYVSRNRLMQYNIEKLAEKELRSWNTPTTLLAWRGESIFARNNQSLLVLGATGENEYEIAALTTDSTVHFGPENRNVWILSEGVLNKLELRKMQGLFGLLRQGKS